MVIMRWTWKHVCRCVKATGHWFWVGFQYQGYILAMAYLPEDETQELENPEIREYQISHSS